MTATASPAFCNARAKRYVLPGSTTMSFSATASHIGGSAPSMYRIGWLAARTSGGKTRSSMASCSGKKSYAPASPITPAMSRLCICRAAR
ncbi:hypothetical protein WL98_21750 [Burkholderia multivorans]|nr:hypothetical protein WL98_21750 [Burkholderia multivorans]